MARDPVAGKRKPVGRAAARRIPRSRPSGRAKGAAGPVPYTVQFTISTALLEELGERLVSKPEVALAELIKNSYDADAETCTIELGAQKIVITDTGHGMTESQFLRNWMVVSSQEKGKQRYSHLFRRAMAGSKGIGRFSARFLGNVVKLESVAIDAESGVHTKLVADFDWEAITRKDAIEAVDITYTIETLPAAAKTGTTLTITRLRREAKQISAARVKSDILRLTNPITGLERPPFGKKGRTSNRPVADPGFSVVFAGVQDSPDEIPPNLQTAILDAYVGRVRMAVSLEGELSYKVFWRDQPKPIHEASFQIGKLVAAYSADKLRAKPGQKADDRGLIKEVEKTQHLPLAKTLNSPVFIDLRFFPFRKGTFSGLGVNGKKALAWINENASFALVDNLFAMNGYGADSDWLGIDVSKAHNHRDWQSIFTPAFFPMAPQDKSDPKRNPMLALPRGSQIIGRVHIATSKRPSGHEDDSDEWLQPNMDRESLRENGAFRVLWHVARFAAELIAHFDRKIRLEERAAELAQEDKDARSDLAKAIVEIKGSKEIEPQFREKIVQQLRIVQTRFTEQTQYDENARLSLELMSMMGVLAGFMTHEFEKAMNALHDAADMIRELVRKDPALNPLADKILEQEAALAHYMDYMRLYVGRARQPKPQQFKALGQVALVVETLQPIAKAHGINVEIDIDRSLPAPSMPIAAYHGIVANLLSNALKALVPKVSKDPRRVRIYASNDGPRHVLVCTDNGIGIPDYLRTRIWDPLFTTTGESEEENPLGSGLGLGLSVVRQVVRHMRGSIELMDNAPPGYETGFKVSLPLN